MLQSRSCLAPVASKCKAGLLTILAFPFRLLTKLVEADRKTSSLLENFTHLLPRRLTAGDGAMLQVVQGNNVSFADRLGPSVAELSFSATVGAPLLLFGLKFFPLLGFLLFSLGFLLYSLLLMVPLRFEES